jgi:putative ATP-binding cassette transporter
LYAVARPFFVSSEGGKALGLLGLLVVLSLSINGLNIISSYLNRDMMTVLADGKPTRFFLLALQCAGIVGIITVVAVFFRFIEERFALYWRQWLTDYFLHEYLGNRAYCRLNEQPDIDNPDQRITEDIRTFTATTLSFFLIILNSVVAFIGFASILWSITPWLVYGAMAYAAIGSIITFLLGYRLVHLNFLQLKKEADLRYDLIQIREHADAVALNRGESKELTRVQKGLAIVVDNLKRIISVNRNLSFFTTGYNYWAQLVPIIIVAPIYLDGNREFGVVTQAASAFVFVLGAFSLIITEFQRLSSFVAIVSRLDSLNEAMLKRPIAHRPTIEIVDRNESISYENLTILGPENEAPLILNLNLEISPGRRLVILGPNRVGKSLLVNATAGIWTAGKGRIKRPQQEQLMFLPQHPYLKRGSLRSVLTYPCVNNNIEDQLLVSVLNIVQLGSFLNRVGGLDADQDWSTRVSTSESQLLSIAQLLIAKPQFAFLDEAISTLVPEVRQIIYKALHKSSITYISTTNDPALLPFHDQILELKRDGLWTVRSIASSNH